MKNIVKRLKQEARILSIICTCDKTVCGNCRRKKLCWDAAKEIEELKKQNDQICIDCKASVDCKRLDYFGHREYCKWQD